MVAVLDEMEGAPQTEVTVTPAIRTATAITPTEADSNRMEMVVTIEAIAARTVIWLLSENANAHPSVRERRENFPARVHLAPSRDRARQLVTTHNRLRQQSSNPRLIRVIATNRLPVMLHRVMGKALAALVVLVVDVAASRARATLAKEVKVANHAVVLAAGRPQRVRTAEMFAQTTTSRL